MATRRQQVGLGLFVLLAIGSFVGFGLFFSNRADLLTARDNYPTVFEDARGLGVGTPIRRSGVRIGQVTDLQLNDDGTVTATLTIDRRFPPRADEEPTITRGLISGDSTIDLLPRLPIDPKADRSPLPAGTKIIGKSPVDPRIFVNQAADVLPTAQSSLDAIRKSVQRLEKLEPQFEQALETIVALAIAAREFVPEFRRTNDQFQKLLMTIDDARPELKRTNTDLQVLLTNASRAAEQINVLVASNQKALTEGISQLTDVLTNVNAVLGKQNQDNFAAALKNLREVSDDLRPLAKELAGISKDVSKIVKDVDGVVNDVGGVVKESELFVKDGRELVQRLQTTAKNLDGAITDVRKISGPLADSVPQLARNLQSVSEQANALLLDGRELLRVVARGDGTVQKLLSDPTLYANLNNLIASISRLGPSLERTLRDVEVFADKIARHPEILGVRGAVVPSAGIKEASPQQPSAYPNYSPYPTIRPH
jgi:phospholipid/cholesterol/gamma-HCH transport system substrate-binding protein